MSERHTFIQAKLIAARHGASQPGFPASDERAKAWVKAVAGMDMADDGELVELIERANRLSRPRRAQGAANP